MNQKSSSNFSITRYQPIRSDSSNFRLKFPITSAPQTYKKNDRGSDMMAGRLVTSENDDDTPFLSSRTHSYDIGQNSNLEVGNKQKSSRVDSPCLSEAELRALFFCRTGPNQLRDDYNIPSPTSTSRPLSEIVFEDQALGFQNAPVISHPKQYEEVFSYPGFQQNNSWLRTDNSSNRYFKNTDMVFISNPRTLGNYQSGSKPTFNQLPETTAKQPDYEMSSPEFERNQVACDDFISNEEDPVQFGNMETQSSDQIEQSIYSSCGLGLETFLRGSNFSGSCPPPNRPNPQMRAQQPIREKLRLVWDIEIPIKDSSKLRHVKERTGKRLFEANPVLLESLKRKLGTRADKIHASYYNSKNISQVLREVNADYEDIERLIDFGLRPYLLVRAYQNERPKYKGTFDSKYNKANAAVYKFLTGKPLEKKH